MHSHDGTMETLDLHPNSSYDSPLLSSRKSTRESATPSYTPPQFQEHSHHHHTEKQVDFDFDTKQHDNFFVHIIQQISSDSDRQPLLVYLGLRILYTIVALVSSSLSSSVGLVCIAFHSLFECVGLAVELWAGAAERDRMGEQLTGFSYGYQRLEVLSAFGNTVFLIFVSLFTLEHAIERIFEPPMVSSGLVMAVALIGCIINLIGLLITQSSRTGESKKALHGQVLWVRLVTDNLVSFGVSFSAFCSQYGYHEADPIVAGLISIAVIYTSIPLARKTKDMLLLATPNHIQRELYRALGEVLSVDGILECSQEHFWTCAHGTVVGSLQVTISDQADEQKTLQKVNGIFRPFVQNLTVQIQRNNWDLRSAQLQGEADASMDHDEMSLGHGHSHSHGSPSHEMPLSHGHSH